MSHEIEQNQTKLINLFSINGFMPSKLVNGWTVLRDAQTRPQVELPLKVRENLGVMAMKIYSTFCRAPGL